MKLRAGFTLVEALLTMVILSIGIIAILGAYRTSLNALEAIRDNAQALSLLKEKMADIEIKAVERQNLTPGASRGSEIAGESSLGWESNIQPLEMDDSKLKNCLNEVRVSVSGGKKAAGFHFTAATYVENVDAFYG
jgi:type II secretion system protein I